MLRNQPGLVDKIFLQTRFDWRVRPSPSDSRVDWKHLELEANTIKKAFPVAPDHKEWLFCLYGSFS